MNLGFLRWHLCWSQVCLLSVLYFETGVPWFANLFIVIFPNPYFCNKHTVQDFSWITLLRCFEVASEIELGIVVETCRCVDWMLSVVACLSLFWDIGSPMLLRKCVCVWTRSRNYYSLLYWPTMRKQVENKGLNISLALEIIQTKTFRFFGKWTFTFTREISKRRFVRSSCPFSFLKFV